MRRIVVLALSLAVIVATGRIVWSAFVHVPIWDATFETEPLDTDSVGDGAQEIRTLKQGISERMAVQHQFGPGTPDTGFHTEGSAWAEMDADCSSLAIDPDHEPGRLCVDTTDMSLWVLNATATAYTQINGVPQYSIILFDDPSEADEDCDGTKAEPGELCPCGYSEATEFQNLTVRGADTDVTHPEAWIPDDAGENCVGDGSGNDPPCVTQTGRYDDQISQTQMPYHDHTGAPPVGTRTFYDISIPVTPVCDVGVGISATIDFIIPEGGDEDHYHPFRTVIFCRKN